MKNIIIYGAGRSGKSTLARMIKNKWGHSWISLDPLRNIYDVILGEDSANDWSSDIAALQEKWSKPIIAAIDNFSHEGNGFNEWFVFEGWVIDLEQLLRKIDKDKFIIIGMGYPNISSEEKLKQLLEYENPMDWTIDYTLEEKKGIVEHILLENKYIQSQIQKFNIPFFDTSFDRDKVLKNIMKYLEENLQKESELEQYRDVWMAEKLNDYVGFYEREFYCFSNFSAFEIVYDGKVYPTVEHAYQAEGFKITSPKIAEQIRSSLSADDAKRISSSNVDKKVKNWNEIKIGVMEKLLRLKLEQNAYVKKKLLQTKDYLICEDSPFDSFWGIGADRNGRNELGKLWMKLRDEIKNN